MGDAVSFTAGFTPDVKYTIDFFMKNIGKMIICNQLLKLAIQSVEPTNEDTLYRLLRIDTFAGIFYLGAFSQGAIVNFLLDFTDPMRTFSFVKDYSIIYYVTNVWVGAPFTLKKASES